MFMLFLLKIACYSTLTLAVYQVQDRDLMHIAFDIIVDLQSCEK